MKKCDHKWKEVGRDLNCYQICTYWCPKCGAISKGFENRKIKTTYSDFYREKSIGEKE